MFAGPWVTLRGTTRCATSAISRICSAVPIKGTRFGKRSGPEFYDGVANESGMEDRLYVVGAPRDLTAKKAITKPEEVAGLKIRVPTGQFSSRISRIPESVAHVITFRELFTALKPGSSTLRKTLCTGAWYPASMK